MYRVHLQLFLVMSAKCLCVCMVMSAFSVTWLSRGDCAETVEFDDQALEFFEREVRPLLVRRCYECHSSRKDEPDGGLRLDSRATILTGGDTGPAITPKDSEKSLLIDAINYGEVYQMPPKSKMPAKEIAILKKWVDMGAPWPAESGSPAATTKKHFDLAARKDGHWCWQPIRSPAPPRVTKADWPTSPIDYFILSRLEQEGLSPAAPAARRTLLRRAYLDLIGLPPTPKKVEAFLADDSPKAFENVVDRLLDSEHFGERWGRHWLDLVRYAESRGHEFDPTTPNAYQYRDYVIRAFNADVPYDQFVVEHLAGDLLAKPRLHPQQQFNESILATGFWFLGEWVHSPVDIRQDELDRYDNMLDVMSKTFLGLTLACARCHDHKFDAILQRDYYAMSSFLQSSNYRLARFDSMQRNQQVARDLERLERTSARAIPQAIHEAREPMLDQLAVYLLAAREALQSLPAPSPSSAQEVMIADFEDATYDGWKIEGTAFGDQPQTQETIGKYQGDVGAAGKFFVNSHNLRREGGPSGDPPTGQMTSAPFKVTRRFLRMLVGGGAHRNRTCVNVLVDGKVVASLTGKNNNRMELQWVNVDQHQDKQARIQIVDNHTGGWGNIGVDHIVLSNEGPPNGQRVANLAENQLAHVQEIAERQGLDAAMIVRWVEHLLAAKTRPADPLHYWAAAAHGDPAGDILQHAWKPNEQPLIEIPTEAVTIVDYAKVADGAFLQDGSTFGSAPRQVGDLMFGTEVDRPIVGVLAHGAAVCDPVWRGLRLAGGQQKDHGKLGSYQRSGRTLRTPSFTVSSGKIWLLVKGAGTSYAAVDSHATIAGPLHGALVAKWDHADGAPRWVNHNLSAYVGHRVHLEITPGDATDLQVMMAVDSQNPPKFNRDKTNQVLVEAVNSAKTQSASELAKSLEDLFKKASHQFSNGTISDADAAIEWARLANWMVQNQQLFVIHGSESAKGLSAASAKFIAERQKLAASIQHESRIAMAIMDGSREEELLLIRGNPRTPGKPVRASFLTAIGDLGHQVPEAGSGRMALAKSLIDPNNPLTSRVIVNRLWHHLFGRGIVPSVDNFGVLGQESTHPELLDFLATRFMQEGWSMKRMIKTMMLSSTYQMASTPNPTGTEKDPGNKLLHRMRIRRLQGEAIRDQILAISGRLDRRMYGPSVDVHLTSFMQGRGRPGRSGPLDGAGRRSIYVGIRRNFISPMMLTFDAPIPFTTIGRRNVSNVPAQALILMNDPFVVDQARLWAKRTLEQVDRSAKQRIERLYLEAFCRPPSQAELSQAVAFLKQQAESHGIPADQADRDERVWADLCHVLMNVKEFIYLN